MKKKYLLLLIGLFTFLFVGIINVQADEEKESGFSLQSFSVDRCIGGSDICNYGTNEKNQEINIFIDTKRDITKEIKTVKFTFEEVGAYYILDKNNVRTKDVENPTAVNVTVNSKKSTNNNYLYEFIIPIKDYFNNKNYKLIALEVTYNDGSIEIYNSTTNVGFTMTFSSNYVFSMHGINPITSIKILNSNGDDDREFYDRTAPLRLKVESKKSGIEKFVLTFRNNCSDNSNDPKKTATVEVSHLMTDYYAVNLADVELEDNFYNVCILDVYYNDSLVYRYKWKGTVANIRDDYNYLDAPFNRNFGFFSPPLNRVSLKQKNVKLNEKLYLDLSLYKDVIAGNLVFKQNDRTLTVSINDINTDFPYVVIPYTSPLGELTLTEVSFKTTALYTYAREQGETTNIVYKPNANDKDYHQIKMEFGDTIIVEKDNSTIQAELLNLDNDILTDDIIEDIKKVDGTTTINLDANKKTKVSSELFNLIKNKDITLNIQNNENIWSINGNDIKYVKDIDVTTELLKPDKDLSKKIDKGIILSFKDNGKLPGKMTIRINNNSDVSNALEGKPVNLYVFNEKEKNFELVKEDIKIDNEGFYNLELDHNSKYVISVNKIKDKYLKGYSSNLPVIIAVIFIPLLIIAVVVVILLKNKKNIKEEKQEEVKEEKKEDKKETKKPKNEATKEIDEEEFVLNIKR